MALRTRQDYLDSIGQLDTALYAFGSQVTDLYDYPCVRPAMDAIGLVYDLAVKPDNEEFFTAPSPFTGGRVNRFLHIHQSQEDLQSRFRLARLMVRKLWCMHRCQVRQHERAELALRRRLRHRSGTWERLPWPCSGLHQVCPGE